MRAARRCLNGASDAALFSVSCAKIAAPMAIALTFIPAFATLNLETEIQQDVASLVAHRGVLDLKKVDSGSDRARFAFRSNHDGSRSATRGAGPPHIRA